MHDIFNLFYTTASATALWAARSVDMCSVGQTIATVSWAAAIVVMCSVGQTIAFTVAQIVVPSACLNVKPFHIEAYL